MQHLVDNRRTTKTFCWTHVPGLLGPDLMPKLALDHLVLAAADLAQGVSFVADRLGVRAPAGGRHAVMGTHNALVRLGRDVYLEIIAIDPEAPAPARARWFGLDEPRMRRRLAEQPRIVTWVAR